VKLYSIQFLGATDQLQVVSAEFRETNKQFRLDQEKRFHGYSVIPKDADGLPLGLSDHLHVGRSPEDARLSYLEHVKNEIEKRKYELERLNQMFWLLTDFEP
jgi:hypothetical protein